MKKVIINVDDLGLSHQVNQAVVDLASMGRISATSYMVGGQISSEHKQTLKKLNIDIGLHLDFTGIFNSPLTGALKQTIINSYTRKFNTQQVTDNIKQQFDDFEAVFGDAPVFVDGHQHVHQFPIIRDVLIKEMIQRRVNYARITKPLVNDLKSWIIYTLGGKAWAKLCHANGIQTNAGFAGVYGFDKDVSGLSRLWQTWLSACPDGLNDEANDTNDENKQTLLIPSLTTSLIMCHPATPVKQEDADYNDEIKSARETEYEWLMSDEFAKCLIEHQVELSCW